MTENVFLTDPVRVVVYDPVTNTPRRTFVFLGDVPKSISAGINAPAKLLRDFYGPNYRAKLGEATSLRKEGGNDLWDSNERGYDLAAAWNIAKRNSPVSFPLKEFTDVGESDPHDDIAGRGPILITDDLKIIDGKHRVRAAITRGDDSILAYIISRHDLGRTKVDNSVDPMLGGSYQCVVEGGAETDADLDDIEELLNEPSRAPMLTGALPELTFAPGVEYPNVHIFPEDKLSEIKEKIYIATKIPVYRQHLFYMRHGRPWTTYRVQAGGIYDVNISAQLKGNDSGHAIHGMPIDKNLYDLRNIVRVEAFDAFTVAIDAEIQDNTFYVVDLAQFTAPYRTQLAELANDTYQFDLFYYGFIIKFWPQLTKECLRDYLIQEGDLQHKYPDLAKNLSELGSVYRAEKELITAQYKNATKAASFATNNITMGITQMTAVVTASRVMLNIRNLYDSLRVTKCMPEIHAYADYEGRKYLLRKQHSDAGFIAFPTVAAMRQGIIIAISLRKSDQEGATIKSVDEQSRYLFINIWANGRYFIKTSWNEEDELGFTGVIKIMKKFTDPVISAINKLGRLVFISGEALQPLTKQNVTFRGMNICVFWKKVMLEGAFKAVKALWDQYYKAKIIGVRASQQFDKHEFTFRKGIHEFDTDLIERIVTASNNIILTNYYAYLSNSAVKQKWDQTYDGRVVRMSHRTTDIRFEVNDIREHEFATFYNYIVGFAYNASISERLKLSMAPKSYKDVKKLRKLREQDPELFNLKKYGSKKVYSIVCQNQRQPIIYTADELKTMTAAQIAELTQYWNFTMNKPAYYGCPSKKYPHLGFIVGVHPKHYCLPCCNKIDHLDDDRKKSRASSACLRDHKFTDTGHVETSRHVMNYGKIIDVGRLARPPLLITALATANDSTSHKVGLYLCGVDQNLPGANNVGMIFSLAEALGKNVVELARDILTKLAFNDSLFSILLNGSLIDYFQDVTELNLAISDVFLRKVPLTGRFDRWPELFVELCSLVFGVHVFTFVDADGTGSVIELFVPRSSVQELNHIAKISGRERPQAIVIMKQREECYPIFAVDAEKYFKSSEIAQRIFQHDHPLSDTLAKMAGYGLEEAKFDRMIDLQFALAELPVVKKFINRQNLCYAVEIKGEPVNIYLPIDYSAHTTDGIPITFEAARGPPATFAAVSKMIEDINAAISARYTMSEANHLRKYKHLIASHVVKFGSSVAIAYGDVIIPVEAINDPELAKLPIRTQNYDTPAINALILSRVQPVKDARVTRLGQALYNNHAYSLFVIEFVNYLNAERNHKIRDEIKTLIRGTNFKKNIGEFRNKIKILLKDYPTDYAAINSQLNTFYYSHQDRETLFDSIDATNYDFDRMTVARLKKYSAKDLRTELMTIAGKISVEKEFDASNIQFPNIYVPCADRSEEYCAGKKLIVRNMGEYVDLLAADLTNELKSRYILNDIWMDITVDWLSFTRVPGEIITIYRLTE